MLGRLPDLSYFESLASLMRSLFVVQVKQDLVAQIGMDATFVGFVEAEIRYVLLFSSRVANLLNSRWKRA